MTAAPDLDALIPRLRSRAADPERRTDARPSEFEATVSTLDLGGLATMGRGIGALLRDVVAANQSGRVDEAGHRQALELERAMSTPAPTVLPAPADAAAIERAEAALGVRLPVALRRVYAEVADGGFGPGPGIAPLGRLAATYADLRRSNGRLPRGRVWPDGLLPVVELEPGFDCVDAATGRVIEWDPEELAEHSREDRFRRSFRERHPSVEAWLGEWVGSKTAAEQRAELMERVMGTDAQVRMAREARAAIGQKTPEERAAMGLPAVGWEKVVWGGLGWEESEDGGSSGATG